MTNILITGASGGIGQELVKKFVSLGGNVIGSGTKSEKLDLLKKKYPSIKVKKFDISDHSRLGEFIDEVFLELGGLDNPPSNKRIKYVVECAKELLPQLGKREDEWLGFRPTLPDFLPILGPSLKNKNIIYAFGHQHLGWTLGAITGKIISGIVAGDKTNLNLAPYSSKRFN